MSASTERRGFARGLDRLFRTTLVIIPLGVIGNIVLSLMTTDRELLGTLGQLSHGYLLFALALGILPWFTNALRLLIWTRFLGHRLAFRDAFEITLGTDLGAAVSPTAVGGGFFKWGMLVQRGVTPGTAASLATVAPIEDAVFFAIALPIAIYFTASWDHPVLAAAASELTANLLPVLVGTAAIALVSWLAVRMVVGGTLGRRTQRRGLRVMRRTRSGIRGTLQDARSVYRLIGADGKARFALTLSLTAIQWVARYSIISVLIAFLGAPVQPVLFWLLQWVVFTLAAAIPTPGAAGGAEAAFYVIYSPFVPSGLMGLATAGWRFFTFYLLLLLAAFVYIAIGGLRRTDPRGVMAVDNASAES